MGAVQTRRTVPYPFAERSFQWGYGGCRGGLRGEIEIFPGPPAKNVIKELPSLLFISTPQSIAKPSPGWNKVALLTAVRNSPCSCPFSVSLHPPLAALNSEPRPGSLLVRFTSSRIKQTRGRSASPHFYNLLCLSAVSGFRCAHKRAYGFAVLAAAAGIMVPSALTYTLSTLAPERVIR